MKFIELNLANKDPIYLDYEKIESMCIDESSTCVIVNGIKYLVKETPKEIIDMISEVDKPKEIYVTIRDQW